MKAKFVMDPRGNFCIEVDGKRSFPTFYQGIAYIEVDGRKFIGVSDYFRGELPTTTVLEIMALETENVEESEKLIQKKSKLFSEKKDD